MYIINNLHRYIMRVLSSILYFLLQVILFIYFFFFNDTATTEIYTLSLHDALPISNKWRIYEKATKVRHGGAPGTLWVRAADRKSTRLKSSHLVISYAVFCLKKKKKT